MTKMLAQELELCPNDTAMMMYGYNFTNAWGKYLALVNVSKFILEPYMFKDYILPSSCCVLIV